MESAPPAVLGDLPVPARYWEYSGQEWNIAVSPRKLEDIRQRLTSTQRAIDLVRASFKEDTVANAELAEQVELGRLRLRDLREEEAAATTTSSVVEYSPSSVYVEDDSELIALRDETGALAGEVEGMAQMQIGRCAALQDLRIAAKLAHLKRNVKAEAEVHQDISAHRMSQEKELVEALQDTDSLMAATEQRRREVRAIVDEEIVMSAARAEREAAQGKELAALRSEFNEALETKRSASLALAAQHQAQASRRRRATELAARVAETRNSTQRVAKCLQEAGVQAGLLQVKMTEARRSVDSARDEAAARSAACRLLEAELQQQRDATLAWQACAGDLAQGHVAISAETAKAVAASHNALCRSATPLDAPPQWCGAGIPMATR